MVEDFDAEKVTRARRAKEARSGTQKPEKKPATFGLSPDSPILRLERPSRMLAADLINAINENILRNYVKNGSIEHALWILPTNEEGNSEREKIKKVLADVFSGWAVTFANEFGEKIILTPRPPH